MPFSHGETWAPAAGFSIPTISHGELALLSVLQLVTVHFFNNHFRPDKFPLDIVMFTGLMPLEDFMRSTGCKTIIS